MIARGGIRLVGYNSSEELFDAIVVGAAQVCYELTILLGPDPPAIRDGDDKLVVGNLLEVLFVWC